MSELAITVVAARSTTDEMITSDSEVVGSPSRSRRGIIGIIIGTPG